MIHQMGVPIWIKNWLIELQGSPCVLKPFAHWTENPTNTWYSSSVGEGAISRILILISSSSNRLWWKTWHPGGHANFHPLISGAMLWRALTFRTFARKDFQAELRYHSVDVEFERETEVKDIKKVDLGLQAAVYCSLFSNSLKRLTWYNRKKIKKQEKKLVF